MAENNDFNCLWGKPHKVNRNIYFFKCTPTSIEHGKDFLAVVQARSLTHLVFAQFGVSNEKAQFYACFCFETDLHMRT